MTERDFRYEMPDGKIVEAFQVTDASLFQDALHPEWFDSKMLFTKGSADSTKTKHWLNIGGEETEIPAYGWIVKDQNDTISAVGYEVMEEASKVVKERIEIPDAAVPMTDQALHLASKLAKRSVEECRQEDLANVEQANRNRQAMIDSLDPEDAAERGLKQTGSPEVAQVETFPDDEPEMGDQFPDDYTPDVPAERAPPQKPEVRMTYCSICSCKFDAEYEGVEGDIGIIPVAFCATCKTGIRDFAEQVWDLAPTGEHHQLRIPYHTFKNPVCRGDPTLGNNCGHCEKCEWLAGQ